MTMGEKALIVNLEYVRRNKAQLLAEYKNKFVLVHSEKIVGSYDTYESAASEGVRSYGITGEFLVYHVMEEEPLNFVMEALL